MNLMTWFVLIAFLPLSVVIFATRPPRQAFLSVIFGGFLFLPVASIEVPVLADFGKASAPPYAALICTAVFHPQLLLGYRFKWFDLPMYGWFLWQIVPSVANGHGLYDGLSQLVNFLIVWALPYFLARCYFTKPEHLREVAVALVACGLVYLPLCLFEIRFSPSLHLWIYGRYPCPFFDMVRLGGYRPVVFMQHGLMLAFFMCSAAFVAGWLWWFRKPANIKRIGLVPIAWATGSLIPMAILTRSAGALMIFAGLTGLVVLAQAGKWKWVLLLPVVLMPFYIGTRTAEITDGRFMVDITNSLFSREHGREGSLTARLDQEDREIVRIREKPLTGWSNWNYGQDQLWLLLARNTGLPTIAAWLFVYSMPLVMALCSNLRKRRELLFYGLPLSLVLVGWVMDGLFNGMFNPMWPVCAAAVMTAVTNRSQGPLLDSTEFTESHVHYSMPEMPQAIQPQDEQVTVGPTSHVLQNEPTDTGLMLSE